MSSREPAAVLLHRVAHDHPGAAVVGLPLFLMLGSPYVRGRRMRIQQDANKSLAEGLEQYPDLPEGADPPRWLESFAHMNRRLHGFYRASRARPAELLTEEHATIASIGGGGDSAADYVPRGVFTSWRGTAPRPRSSRRSSGPCARPSSCACCWTSWGPASTPGTASWASGSTPPGSSGAS
ncbi:hypothetical protein QJS66_15765 [Kocuria rhizophila]|nr:hypothetical protein QJS66_15765 [Kocuria rhizophila]